jgi:hypothetical protein
MFQLKKNPSNMSNTYADISNTTSSSLKRSTDADVNGSNTVNNEKYSGNFHADLVYSKEEAYQKSNTIDTGSTLDLECYDHLNARNTLETMLNEICIAAMSVLEVILTLHTIIQPWVLHKRKTLTIFMITPWRA